MPSVKLKFQGVAKRIKIDKDIIVFDDLDSHAKASFPSISNIASLIFVWEDDDGDKLHCSRDDEIKEAVSAMIEAKRIPFFNIEIDESKLEKPSNERNPLESTSIKQVRGL